MRAGIFASALRVIPPSWHVAYGTNLAALDLGREDADRHVALILTLPRAGGQPDPGNVSAVAIGGAPLTIDRQAWRSGAAKVVVAHGPAPVDGPLTYVLDSGVTSDPRALTASWRGAISPVQHTGGELWSNALGFTLNAHEGCVGLISGSYSGVADWPANVTSHTREAAHIVTDDQPWSLYRARVSNAVGAYAAATFAPDTPPRWHRWLTNLRRVLLGGRHA